MFEEKIELIKLIQQYPTGCSNGSNILNDVWREDWINQTHPTISNRMFKQIQHVAGREDWTNQTNQTNIQHFGWCLKRRPQYPTGCLNGSNILDDVWREDWTNQTHPTISNRVFKWIQHFVWCLKRRLNQSNSSNNILTGCSNGSNILDDVWREDWTINQTHPTISNKPIKLIPQYPTGVQTDDPTFWMMMFEEKIEPIKLIQQYRTGCSNGSNMLGDVGKEDWTIQTYPTISNTVFKRI